LLKKNENKIEKYSEIIIKDLGETIQDVSDTKNNYNVDYHNVYKNVKYNIDNLRKFNTNIDKSPTAIQDFID
jgi:hypothetical protein